MLQVSVLGSGSKGNSILVYSENTQILIDAGFSSSQLHRRIEQVGRSPLDTAAILITHEHGDHVKGLDVFCKKVPATLYANRMTRQGAATKIQQPKDWMLFETGARFAVGDLEIQTFPVPHDAAEPLGYVVHHGGASFGVLTDVGYVTKVARKHLEGIDTLYLEANYDPKMLEEDTRRPWSLKQRIASRHGHLSNEDAAQLIVELAESGLRQVVVGHLSSDCNTPECVRETMAKILPKSVQEALHLQVSSQEEPSELLKVAVTAAGTAAQVAAQVEAAAAAQIASAEAPTSEAKSWEQAELAL